jgi:hypothetical protein
MTFATEDQHTVYSGTPLFVSNPTQFEKDCVGDVLEEDLPPPLGHAPQARTPGDVREHGVATELLPAPLNDLLFQRVGFKKVKLRQMTLSNRNPMHSDT